MYESVRDVIVIGGGISGLTAAWHLRRANVDVCLLESNDGVGGCTRTERRDGFLLEKGPFNVMVRDRAFEELLVALSDKVNVVSASKAAHSRYIYRRGRLWKVPSNPIALATAGLLSFGSKCRLLAGLLVSSRAGEVEETIEQVAVRRFGREVTDTMISSVIAGIFAGDIRRLSLRACFPTVARVDGEARSLLGYGLTAPLRSKGKKKEKHRRRWRGLVSIDGGLGALTTAMGNELGESLITGCRIESVHPAEGGYEVIAYSDDDTQRELRCRKLIVATPASEGGRLLATFVPEATEELRAIESSSLVVLNLGFKRGDIGHPLNGFGFLVPHDEPDFPLMGVLFADSMFPHHAPPDHRLIRVFIGGVRDPEAASRSDAELLVTATTSLRDLLQITGEPVLVDPCRYHAAIPQYHLGHVEKTERLRAAVAAHPGLHLIGNYLEGVSLNDCVRFAKRVANEVKATVVDAGAGAAELASSAS
ncbi:MAG: protoporphyrinogen oxidase [Planctomycetota bacterium]|jgi:oxygen-dependent protoporphyrinogen oxidase